VATGDQDAVSSRVDRRAMLKGAAAASAAAAVWVAPRIESLGFSPAGAGVPAGTPCVILSHEDDDTNSNSGTSYCPIVTEPCCGQNYGNNGNVETFTFANPAPNCTSIVVRTIGLDCNFGTGNPERNPDVGQQAVVIESATGAGCGACQVLDGVLIASSGRTVLQSLNNGAFACPPAGFIGDGVDASILCTNPLLASDARFAVRITCLIEDGDCDPDAPQP